MTLAEEAGLDLVEISPNANPPVCKVMDFGKYKYNDIKLNKSDFSIKKLEHDTGYAPQNNFEEIVTKLHSSLIKKI